MATPEDFIEIADFSQGIHSDTHANLYSGLTWPEVGDGLRGFAGVQGAATVENTYGCRADKSGALIPLPYQFDILAHESEGVPTDEYGVDYRPARFSAAYVADVEISPHRFHESANWSFGADNFSVYVLWGFYYATANDGTTNGFYPYMLGREYIRAPLYNVDYLDFMFGKWNNAQTNPGILPAGSLCIGHADYNATPANIAANGVRFDIGKTIPVAVGLATLMHTAKPNQTSLYLHSIDPIPVAEEPWLSQIADPPGGGALDHRPSKYTPGLSYLGGGSQGTAIGMSWGREHFDPFAPPNPPINEWRWHEEDDHFASSERNIPASPYLLIAHQGRIVMADLAGQAEFEASIMYDPSSATSDAVFLSRDVLWYSGWGLPIGDVYTPSGYADPAMRGYTPLLVGEDTPSRIGCIGVTTADELFVVKDHGGGALVRGDLDNPTVRRLPHIEPTFGVASKGVATPIGFVYGSRSGVYVFDGGDTSQELSAQLEGFFWNVFDDTERGSTDTPTSGSYGRFAYWHGMVMVPNNYIYDTETNSWWRWRSFVDQHNYSAYLVTPHGRLFAFPYKTTATAAAPQPVWHEMRVTNLAHSYSWQSQPLVETRGRRQSFQDVRLLVTVDPNVVTTFTVTLTGYDEEAGTIATDSVVLTAAQNENPQVLRADLTPAFVAEYVQVRIEASAADDGRGPKIHALRLGIKSRQTTPRHG